MISCQNNIPKNYKSALKRAGKNKSELLKTIQYFKKKGDKEKLNAAYFLIANMPGKYGIYYPDSSIFYFFKKKIDSIEHNKKCIEETDNFIKSYIKDYPKLLYQTKEIKFDIDIVTSELLINNIELAFKVWKTYPWSKNLNFNEFCEWILPYRILNEPLQNWRKYILEKINLDTIKNITDRKEICFIVNKIIADSFYFNSNLDFLPILGGIDLYNLKMGECIHRYVLITMVMRSLGIPVAIDFTYQYASWPGNHSWTVLLDNNGKIRPFNGGEKIIKFKPQADCPLSDAESAITTIFRRKFSIKNNPISRHIKSELCANITDNTIEEVTYQYDGINQGDISLILNHPVSKYVFLFSFEKGLKSVPISWAKVNKNKAIFKNIGKGGVYYAGYIINDKIIADNNPFVWIKNHEIFYLSPKENNYDTAIIYRKYPINYPVWDYMNYTVGSVIIASIYKDFSVHDTILKIDNVNDELNQYIIKNNKRYRYFKYISSPNGPIRLAELELITIINDSLVKNKGITEGYASFIDNCSFTDFKNIMDGNIRTNLNAPPGTYFIIKYKEPVKIDMIRIIVRNHFNIIEPGHQYELFYFDKGWHSLGKTVAYDYYVKYNKVPIDAILLLKDLTEGIEERIFVINKEGKQAWW